MKLFFPVFSSLAALAYLFTYADGLVFITIFGCLGIALEIVLDFKTHKKNQATEDRLKVIEDKLSGIMLGREY